MKNRIVQNWVQLCYMEYQDGITRVTCGGGNYYIGYRFSRRCFDEGLTSRKFLRGEPLLTALMNKGIYFLIYRDGRGDVEKIYVGKAGERSDEALGVSNRIKEHTRDKYKNWDEAVVLTWRDNSMNATLVTFLEHEFHDMIKRFRGEKMLANDITPSSSTPGERELYDLEEFASKHAPRMISALGYTFLEAKKVHAKRLVKAKEIPDRVAKQKTPAGGKPMFDGGTRSGKTQFAKLIARRGGNAGSFGVILRYLAPKDSTSRLPCKPGGRWRKLLEDAGVKFDKNDFVKDWQHAKNPL